MSLLRSYGRKPNCSAAYRDGYSDGYAHAEYVELSHGEPHEPTKPEDPDYMEGYKQGESDGTWDS